MTRPQLLMRGIDPLRDKEGKCKLWEADRDRFDRNKMLAVTLQTPRLGRRWKTEEAWNAPENQKAFKVNHVSPSPTSSMGIVIAPDLARNRSSTFSITR